MNKDASDFMLQKYMQIAGAYFGLRDRTNGWFKAYVSLIGLPLTVLAAIMQIESVAPVRRLDELPTIVSGVLVLIGVLGFFVNLSIVAMRMEMILYARTINAVRRYFGQADLKGVLPEDTCCLQRFLVLPTRDYVPPFFEWWRAMFWQVTLVGIINGLIAGVAMANLARAGVWLSAFCGVAYGLGHLGVYGLMAWRRSREWGPRFKNDLVASQY